MDILVLLNTVGRFSFLGGVCVVAMVTGFFAGGTSVSDCVDVLKEETT